MIYMSVLYIYILKEIKLHCLIFLFFSLKRKPKRWIIQEKQSFVDCHAIRALCYKLKFLVHGSNCDQQKLLQSPAKPSKVSDPNKTL